ncbi:hemagglutinin, partial [Bacillus cereus]
MPIGPIDTKNYIKKMGVSLTVATLSIGLVSGCSLFSSKDDKEAKSKVTASKTDKKKKDEKKSKEDDTKKDEKLGQNDFETIVDNAIKGNDDNKNVAYVLDHFDKPKLDSKDKIVASNVDGGNEVASQVLAILDKETGGNSIKDGIKNNVVAAGTSDNKGIVVNGDNFVFGGNDLGSTVASINDVVVPPTSETIVPVKPPTGENEGGTT